MAVEDFLDPPDGVFPCIVPMCWEKCVEDHALCAAHELAYAAEHGAFSPLVRNRSEWSQALYNFRNAGAGI